MGELSRGTLIAGRYRLDRLLGEGGMGVVWAATHEVMRKPVALKFLRPELAAQQPVRQRFLREARAACAVQHPNVVAVHDVLELDDGSPVMVMDLLTGESLRARLERQPKLSIGELARILLPVVSAVGTAHAAGIVHRDLKPENIFLAKGLEGAIDVKVLDFGVAKLHPTEEGTLASAGLTGAGAMLGTPHYMSPEQAFGDVNIDHRADIWSLGVILYECIAGRRPTQADNLGQILRIIMTDTIRPLAEVAPDAPPDLVALVGRMLSRDRDARPADLREVREVLASFAAEVPTSSFGAPRTTALAQEPGSPEGTRIVSDPGAGALDATEVDPRTPPSAQAGQSKSGMTLGPRPGTARRVGLVAAAIGVLGLSVVIAYRYGSSPSTPLSDPGANAAAASTDVSQAPAPPVAVGTSSAEPPPVPSRTSGTTSEAPQPRPAVTTATPTHTNSARAVAPSAEPSASACGPGESLSKGHCCAVGLVWQKDRCDRPLAKELPF